MQRLLIFAIALSIFVGTATVPVFALYKCDTGQGAKCHCAGGDNCKELEKSGMCGNNSLACTSSQISGVGYTCDCTAKGLGANTNALKPKQPTTKSQ
jgi:hypothetical protein